MIASTLSSTMATASSQAFTFVISLSSSSSSSSIHNHNKVHTNNLISNHFTPIPKSQFSLKPLKFTKPQIPNSISRRSGCFSAALDDLELDNDEDEEITESGSGSGSESESESEEGEGRVYVGNLPFNMTSSQLSEIFGEAGTVVNVEIVYDRVTDRSRGFGFVTMGSVQEAKEAIQMFHGTQVGGRTIRVNFPEVPRGGEREIMGAKIRNSYRGFVDSPHKIYAGNLSWALTSESLKEAFSEQPGLLSAKVIYDKNSGRPRGFGFVTFESAEHMESALNSLDGVEVEGRALRLNRASDRVRVTPTVQESDSESSFDSSELLSNISG
ncbi:hypothetical protein ACFE04_005304 [Oxalis oulophora]